MDYRQPPPNAPLLLFGRNVLAVDRATGRVLWEHSTDSYNVRRFLLDGDRLYVLDEASILHLLVARTGQALAKIDLDLPMMDNMMLDEGRLYIVGRQNLVALDLDGRVLWKQEIELHGSRSLAGMAVPGGNSVQVDYSDR
jgi:outer membrane protein assembly factor BamB